MAPQPPGSKHDVDLIKKGGYHSVSPSVSVLMAAQNGSENRQLVFVPCEVSQGPRGHSSASGEMMTNGGLISIVNPFSSQSPHSHHHSGLLISNPISQEVFVFTS